MADFSKELQGSGENYFKNTHLFPESQRDREAVRAIDAIRKEFAKRVYPHVGHASNAVTQEAAAAAAAAANRRL